MEKIGLIAGNRRFPVIFSESARKKGNRVIAVAIKGETSIFLKRYVDRIYWIKLNEFSSIFEIFKAEGIEKVAMAGQINPRCLFKKSIYNSPEIKSLLVKIKDWKANTIFMAIAEKLKESGFNLIDSTTFLEDFLPSTGILTSLKPSVEDWDDIYFGLDLAKKVAALDIGLTVAVKNKAIVAVEALEGTDNLIRRSGMITRSGVKIVKVSRPAQDMRFDIPVVGYNTVKNLIKAKARCLAIEAGRTLFIDQQKSVELANKRSLSIVCV